MKNFIKPIVLSLFALSIFSCDKVENDEYFLKYSKNFSCQEADFDAVPNNPKKNILVEEYTGHLCGNCPGAALVIKNIAKQDKYKDQIVTVAIHGASSIFNSFTPGADKYFYDFTTPEGIALDTEFGVSDGGLPKGMINRNSFNGKQILGPSKWQSIIDGILDEKPIAWINLNGSIEGNDVCTSVQVTLLENTKRKLNVNVVVVEDHIINWQKDYNPNNPQDIEDYNHSHVLRGSALGTWGINLSNQSSYNSGEEFVFSQYVVEKGDDWKAENLSLIAYIYDADTKEVLQVNTKHL